MPASRLDSDTEFTAHAPDKSNVRWFVCFLLFLATTINYMDRSVFSLIEPQLHLGFMGWIPGVDAKVPGPVPPELRPRHRVLPDRLWRRLPLRRAHHRQARHQDRIRAGHSHLGLRLAESLAGHQRRGLLHRANLPRPRRVRQLPRGHQGHNRVVPQRGTGARHRPLQLRFERQLLHRTDSHCRRHGTLGMARRLPHHRLDGPPAGALSGSSSRTTVCAAASRPRNASSLRSFRRAMSTARCCVIAASTPSASARGSRTQSGGSTSSICRCFSTTTTAWT